MNKPTPLAKKISAELNRREERGEKIGLRSLAKKANRSAQYLSLWLRGAMAKDPPLNVIDAISEELGISRKDSVTLSTGCGNLTLRETINLNPDNAGEFHIDKYREFMSLMEKNKFSQAQWNRIIEIAKEK